MNGIIITVIALVLFSLAYVLYGKYLEKKWGIDPKAKTPAYTEEDGIDYVPAKASVVFGHQFASIAGAGPINGPIIAVAFGWFPVLLWILFGTIFFGAVQDFVAMYASVKNKGRTIGYIIEKYIGKTGKRLFLLFCWLFCILVIAAFADVVAKTFDGISSSDLTVNLANGSVATTSMFFIFAAVGLGFLLRYGRLSPWANTMTAIALLIASIALGLALPVSIGFSTWHIIIFAYIMIASVTPVWALLQPRDYLNSFLLVAMIIASILGIFIANPEIKLPAFTGFYVQGMGAMFPIMFITVACGAVSGFHSLVSSGTSSKQVRNEKEMLPISFGAMLAEGMLAVIALVVVASFMPGEAKEAGYTTPSLIYAGGLANFLSGIGLPHILVFTLLNLAVSAFALTSLDSVARVGRLALQELFLDEGMNEQNITGWRAFFVNKYMATILTLLFAYFLSKVGYMNIWPLFGSANQLLSALALIACAVFLKSTKRANFMLWLPMLIMLAVTGTALVQKIIALYSSIMQSQSLMAVGGDFLQFIFAILLFLLGVVVAIQGLQKLTLNSNTATVKE